MTGFAYLYFDKKKTNNHRDRTFSLIPIRSSRLLSLLPLVINLSHI